MISFQFLLTSLVVVLIPGTGVLYTVSSALFSGKRASLFAAFGCTLGIIPSLLACILGLSALLNTSAIAFQLVKYAGVVYLLYLAWSMWRSPSALVLEEKGQTNLLSYIVKGFLLNILNPKLTIFFLAFLPQFVPHSATYPLMNMFVLGSIFMLMTFLVFVVYGLLASHFSQMVIRSKKVSSAIQKIFAGSFAALGVKLLLSEKTQ